jgi:NADH dehydrogenase/NADH:ubiquinone oxidoreductase subunit G
MINITVNNQTLRVEPGVSLLSACLDNGIYIPNLCYLKEVARPSASCRMCFVEIEGRDQPAAACTETVTQTMVVKTDTPRIRRLQKTALQLLLSVHRVDCKDCPANRNCGLQKIARYLKVGLKSKKHTPVFKEPEVDDRHPCLDYFPNRCILCGKCIRICAHLHPASMLSFARRGFDTIIGTYPHPRQAAQQCSHCMRCVQICPVAALLGKPQLNGSSAARA